MPAHMSIMRGAYFTITSRGGEGGPEGRLKSCVRCGQGFSPRSNRQRFCDPCAVKNERTKNAEYQANFRKRKEDR